MNRARFAIIAALATVAGTHLLAQTPKAPEFKSVLANRRVEPPIKGQAEVEFMQPVSKRNGEVVTTLVRVKNVSQGPIARLTISETWFDGQTQVAASQGALDKILAPGAVDTVTIQTPWNARMKGNSWNFSHANGTVKPRKVAKIDDAKAPPPAGAAKTTAKK
jgi:hypothetical protein